MKFKRTIAVTLSALLALLGPLATVSPAYADTSAELQAKLDQANAELDTIYSKANDVSEALNGTKAKLADTKKKIVDAQAQIEQKQQELKEGQAALSKQAAASYKAGSGSFVSTLLGATSFEDFITRVTYASRISQAQTDNISEVQTVQAELEQSKTELEQEKDQQEQLARDQEQQKQALEAEVGKAQQYVNSLDSQVKAKMAEEQAAARAAAEAQARAAQQQAAAQQQSASQGGAPTGSSAGNAGAAVQPTTAQRQKIVNAALSMIGGTYVYGAYNPAARTFDCSGLVMYCYAQVGISLGHYSESQGAYCKKAATVANAQPGDIVWRHNHVGIYIGNGKTVEAHSPAMGIGWGSLSNFSRVGSPLG